MIGFKAVIDNKEKEHTEVLSEQEKRAFKAQQKTKEIEHHNLEIQAQSDDDIEKEPTNVLAGGILSKYGWTPKKLEAYHKKKRNQDFFQLLLLQVLEESNKQIQMILKYYEEQLKECQKQIEATIYKLQELSDDQSTIERACQYYEKNGKLERNKKGELKEKELRALLKKWENQTGQSIPPDDTATYYILLEILDQIEDQKQNIQANLEQEEISYEYYQLQYDKAQQIAQQLQSGDTNLQLQALEELEHLHIQHQRDLSIQLQSKSNEKENIHANDFIASDFEAQDLDFGFPDLQNNFEQSSQQQSHYQKQTKQAERKEQIKVSKPKNVPSPSSKLPSP